jgi:flagellar basal-body rod protein FlgB
MIENLYAAGNYVISKKMLDATHLRHEALANNIANAETPGYKRRDLSATFEKELNSAVSRGDKTRLKDLPLRTEIDRRTKPIRLDGNNVELDKELLEVNRNALNYDFLAEYIGGNIKTLNKAIRGHA